MTLRNSFENNSIVIKESAGLLAVLPQEVMLMILSHLNIIELANMLQVSRYFNLLTTDVVPMFAGQPFLINTDHQRPEKLSAVSKHLQNQFRLHKVYSDLKSAMKKEKHGGNCSKSKTGGTSVPTLSLILSLLAAMPLLNTSSSTGYLESLVNLNLVTPSFIIPLLLILTGSAAVSSFTLKSQVDRDLILMSIEDQLDNSVEKVKALNRNRI